MMVLWMAYCLAACFLLALAAMTLEHARHVVGVPRRWYWVGAMVGSLVLAILSWIRPGPPSTADVTTPVVEVAYEAVAVLERGPTTAEPASAVLTRRPAVRDRGAAADLARWDRPLGLFWMALTGAGLIYLTYGQRAIRRRRMSWRWAKVDGVPTLISRDTGPAVVGFRDSSVVIPEWVLGMDPAQRRLVLAHEVEHLRAGDARILTVALYLLALMPWNAALWWQVRRLRHAVELDCDARVLSRVPDAGTYGALLIEIGRRSAGHPLPMAAFAGSFSLLERRIGAMFNRKPRAWRTMAVVSTGLAGLLIAMACAVPRPPMAESAAATRSSIQVEARWAGDGAIVVEREDPNAQPLDVRLLAAKLVQQRHPEVFESGLPVDQAVWFVIHPLAPGGELGRSWIGPNSYLRHLPIRGQYSSTVYDRNVGAPFWTQPELAALDALRAEVPDLDRRKGVVTQVRVSGGASFVVHFLTLSGGPLWSEQGLQAPVRIALEQSPIELDDS